MNFGDSKTDVYYLLLDLDTPQKQTYLQQLQQDNLTLYNEVMPLVAAESESGLTELIGFHLTHSVSNSHDYSNQQVDKYLITHELGRGGMGVVYAASRADKSFEQQLAIKFLHGDLARIFDKRSLFTEAQMLAKLNHPHIAKVFDGGVYQDHVYIVMEQVNGDNLEVFRQQNPLSHQEKLLLLIQICSALEHTHGQGLIHGDLKPENILVDDSHHTKLIDFNLTQHPGHLLAFSKEYASPEQQAGENLSSRSDIYSLGKLIEWLFNHDEVKSDINAIVNKACRLQSSERYHSVSQIKQDLHNVLTCKPISLKTNNLLYRAMRLFQRHPISCSLALLLMVSGLAFTSVLIAKNQQLRQEKLIAENMMFEVTSMMFHSKNPAAQEMPLSAVLDLTRRRILSNPNIPKHIKQKMLLAMITPIESKAAKHEPNASHKNK
ncbi:serine/threonine protein kinase [Vibrio intestinalis]|uniref:serine/threonine protein kinase n=1 Tax=Vibrio intestinalis TaxID=2933291 RepID=UPI0021A7D153